MKEKKVLNQLISLLPMPAVVIDNKGVIEEANFIFKEKFNFNRISKKNRVKLQVFLILRFLIIKECQLHLMMRF